MGNTKLTVSLILNDASFTKQLAQVNREIKNTDSEFKKTSSASDKFGSSLEGLGAKSRSLNTQLSQQSDKIRLYKTEIDKTKTTLKDLTDQYDKNEMKLTALNNEYNKAVQVYGKNSTEAKKLATEIQGVEKSQGTLQNQITSTNGRLTSLNTELNKSETEFNKLSKEADKTNKSIQNFKTDKLKKDMQAVAASLDKTSQKFRMIGDGFNMVSRGLGTIALPMAGLAAGAIKVSMNFEKSMSNVAAISGAAGNDFERLSKKAREMGEATSKSAAESADALSYMALAGWDVDQMLTGLEPILRLSEAGNMDLAKASDLATDSMGGLKLGVNELNGYLDIVAQTARKSNTDIQQLMEAFINVGATVTNLGIPIEEASAALGILANNGLKGAEAGTKLNSMLTRMTAQSKVAKKGWDMIGVSVYDSEGQFRGLTTVLNETKDKFGDLTKEQQQYFVKQVVGTDNVNQFINLMQSSGGEIQALTGNIKDSNGALMEMATTMQDNVKGQFTILKSKLEELGIQFGEILLPMLSKFIDKLMSLVDWFSSLDKSTQESIVKFGMWTIGGYAVTKMLGGLAFSISNISGFLGKFIGSAATATTAASGLGTAATAATGVGGAAATTGVMGLGAALKTAAASFAPWALAIAGTVVAVNTLDKHMSEELIPTVDLFESEFTKTADAVYDGNAKLVSGAKMGMVEISEATKTGVQAYLDLDEGARMALFSLYTNSAKISSETATSLKTQFSDMGNHIKAGWETQLNESTTTLSNFFAKSEVLTAESEAKILEGNSTYYANKKIKVDENEAAINKIISEAMASEEGFTQEHYNRISKIMDGMREDTVKAYSASEQEASLILGRLASYDGRITAEMASKHIKEAENMRIGAVDEATKEYDQVVREIERQRDVTGEISAEQADLLIKEADRQRKESVDKAAKMKEDIVKKIDDMGKDTLEGVNRTTGDMMTAWDRFASWWEKLTFNPKKMNADIEIQERRVQREAKGFGGVTRSLDDSATNSISPFSNTLEAPNPSSYAAGTITETINGMSQSTYDDGAMVGMMSLALQESQRQNAIMMQMLASINQLVETEFALNLDGKTLAKATAKDMKYELDRIDVRKNRLGGKF